MFPCGLGDAVDDALTAAAGADSQDEGGAVPGAHDHVCRPWRAMEEVPCLERPLFTLHDEETLAGEHEKALLLVLAVVHRHRLAGREDVEIDAELLEGAFALEVAGNAERSVVGPPGVARVQDEPAFAVRDEAVLRAPEPRLGHAHRPKPTA